MALDLAFRAIHQVGRTRAIKIAELGKFLGDSSVSVVFYDGRGGGQE
jgi:hypothetical protein